MSVKLQPRDILCDIPCMAYAPRVLLPQPIFSGQPHTGTDLHSTDWLLNHCLGYMNSGDVKSQGSQNNIGNCLTEKNLYKYRKHWI